MAAAADKNSRTPVNKGASAPAARNTAGKGGNLPTVISLVAVLVALAAAGGWYWSSRKAEAAEQAAAEATKPRLPAPAQYLALEPPFVVNLNGVDGSPQYLQVEIQLMTRDPVALANLEHHSPAIRARLLMLLAQQDAHAIADRPGKEKLQAQALAEVQKLMRAETGSSSVEQLLFTSFVTQ